MSHQKEGGGREGEKRATIEKALQCKTREKAVQSVILSEVNCRHKTHRQAQPGVALRDSASSLSRAAENERTLAARATC